MEKGFDEGNFMVKRGGTNIDHSQVNKWAITTLPDLTVDMMPKICYF